MEGNWKFQGGGGQGLKSQSFKESMKLNCNLRWGGGPNQKTFCAKGMDTFCSNTICTTVVVVTVTAGSH